MERCGHQFPCSGTGCPHLVKSSEAVDSCYPGLSCAHSSTAKLGRVGDAGAARTLPGYRSVRGASSASDSDADDGDGSDDPDSDSDSAPDSAGCRP